MRRIPKERHRRALELVRRRYEAAAEVARANLDSVNRVRPPALRYRSIDDLVREKIECPGAVSTFAVNMGLITPEDARQVILDFNAAHPEVHMGEVEGHGTDSG